MKLRLFVLGERSGIPEDWEQLGSVALVLAHSAEEALTMYPLRPAVEVSLSKPAVLCVLPNHDADI